MRVQLNIFQTRTYYQQLLKVPTFIPTNSSTYVVYQTAILEDLITLKWKPMCEIRLTVVIQFYNVLPTAAGTNLINLLMNYSLLQQRCEVRKSPVLIILKFVVTDFVSK